MFQPWVVGQFGPQNCYMAVGSTCNGPKWDSTQQATLLPFVKQVLGVHPDYIESLPNKEAMNPSMFVDGNLKLKRLDPLTQ